MFNSEKCVACGESKDNSLIVVSNNLLCSVCISNKQILIQYYRG